MACAAVAHAPRAWAGGGPSRTLVVVNADSPTSLYVGGEYARLRSIGPEHILRLKDIPPRQRTTVDLVRERILQPLQTFLTEHQLTETIDTVAFSTDFPFAADYSADGKSPNDHERVPKHAALTGLTYFLRRVLEKDVSYAATNVNRYAFAAKGGPPPGVGFRSTYAWTGHGSRADDEDAAASNERYLLSTFLGWHGMQGNSVPEILAQLARSAAADATAPKGTVYLMRNKNVRARTRMPWFDQTIEALEARGGKGVVLEEGSEGQDGKTPQNKKDIVGLVAGIASFKWEPAKSEMLPGAIAEHLTSFGARFDGSGQTKCSTYLRAGAAGSSGTVAEPLANPLKFPSPFLHVYYRDGCSLAEAFYRSAAGPYQLLILGDPLCQPYAVLPEVKDAALPKSWRGSVDLQIPPAVGEGSARRYEVFIGGRAAAAGAPGETARIDTSAWADGPQRVRIVGVGAGAVETRHPLPPQVVTLANGSGKVSLKGPRKPVALDSVVKLQVSAPPGATGVQLRHGFNVLRARDGKGTRWSVELPATALGRGITPLHAICTRKDGSRVRSAEILIEVEAPGPLGPKVRKRQRGTDRGKGKAEPAPKGGRKGLQAIVTPAKGEDAKVVLKSLGWGKQRIGASLAKHNKANLEKVAIHGEMHVPVGGVVQLAFAAKGALRVLVRGEEVFAGAMTATAARYVEVSLAKGWHPIEVELTKMGGKPDLKIMRGGCCVPEVLGGAVVRR